MAEIQDLCKKAQKSIDDLKKKLNKAGLADKKEVENETIMVSSELGTELNLNSVAIALDLERVAYQPEKFSGLVYYPENSSFVFVIFESGQIICTGGKNEEQLEEGVENIIEKLKEAPSDVWE